MCKAAITVVPRERHLILAVRFNARLSCAENFASRQRRLTQSSLTRRGSRLALFPALKRRAKVIGRYAAKSSSVIFLPLSKDDG